MVFQTAVSWLGEMLLPNARVLIEVGDPQLLPAVGEGRLGKRWKLVSEGNLGAKLRW